FMAGAITRTTRVAAIRSAGHEVSTGWAPSGSQAPAIEATASAIKRTFAGLLIASCHFDLRIGRPRPSRRPLTGSPPRYAAGTPRGLLRMRAAAHSAALAAAARRTPPTPPAPPLRP